MIHNRPADRVTKEFPIDLGHDELFEVEAVSYTHLTLPTNREV
mgnify:CR=1 FL=1